MRLVFAGTAPFAVASLNALVAARHEVVLVVTQPDRPGNRNKIFPTPVKQAAAKHGLYVYQPERIGSPEAIAQIEWAAPELMIVVAYGQIIPAAVLAIPRLGVLNVHGSLLPRHRGAAPIAGAILAGDPVTGVTVMRMDEQLDHGPVLATREVPLSSEATTESVTLELAGVGASLLVEVVGDLDRHPAVEQNHSAATVSPRHRKEDGELDWSMAAAEIDRRVRALNPWPGTSASFGERVIKLLRGHPVAGSGEPGTVIATTRDGLTIATGDGAFLLEEVQLPGRRPMPARQLLP